MSKVYQSNLSNKFFNHINKNWYCNNTYDKTYKNLDEKSGVYIYVSLNMLNKSRSIVYVGSSSNLFNRHKSHKAITKIINNNEIPVLYFLEMPKGFYDYEIKLISKLKPMFNVQFK